MSEQKTIEEYFIMAAHLCDKVTFTITGVGEKSFDTKELAPILELVEKSQPKTPRGISRAYNGRVGNCPTCKILVSEKTSDIYGKPMNICICGQKLKWPGEKKKDEFPPVEVNAQNTKALREKTGAGMAECKRALEYAKDHGDERLAMAYLRSRALAFATPGMTFDERVRFFMEEE